MDVYFKTVSGSMIILILWLSLSGIAKEFRTLLAIFACCMIAGVSIIYLEPVFTFLQDLESLIPIDDQLLQILLKAVGIGLVGEISAMVCTDSGNGALGKTLQLLTNILILWLCLPLFRSLMSLFQQILEDL